MTDKQENTLTLEIPANEVLSPEQMLELQAEAPVEKAPEKKKPPAEPKKDTREEEIRAAQEAMRRAEAERARMERELAAEKTRAESEKTRAGKLEKDVQKRTGQAIYAHGQATYSEHQQIVNALHAVKLETESAKRDLENALADDNLDARERARHIAAAQERIAAAAADQRSLESGKDQLEERLREARAAMEAHQRLVERETKVETKEDVPPKKEEPAAKSPEPPVDPFEQYVGQFPKASQDWLRAHPEYAKDPKLNKRLQAAALEWDAEDKPLHTAEFIDNLNAKFFPKKEEAAVTEPENEVVEEEEIEPAPTKPSAAKSAVAAPVSRSGAPTRPSDKRSMKVSLTPAEVQHAMEMFGPGSKLNLARDEAMARYGRNKLKAEADGKYLPR